MVASSGIEKHFRTPLGEKSYKALCSMMDVTFAAYTFSSYFYEKD
jgi:hypothetical protein